MRARRMAPSTRCADTRIVYSLYCSICGDQDSGSTMTPLHVRVSDHRSKIRHNKGGCGTVQHLNGPCRHKMQSAPEFNYKVYVVDHIAFLGKTEKEKKYADELLNEMEREWQARVGTVYSGMNGTVDWNNTSNNRRNWQKEEESLQPTINASDSAVEKEKVMLYVMCALYMSNNVHVYCLVLCGCLLQSI